MLKKSIVVRVKKSAKTGELYCAVCYGNNFLSFDRALCSEMTNLSVAELLSKEAEYIIYEERG